MATRRATRKYESLLEFLKDYNTSLKKNSISLTKNSYRGELANEIRLDIVIPDVGRVGPIRSQVVFRGDDGVVALRIPEYPPAVLKAFDKAMEASEAMIQVLIELELVIRLKDHQAVLAQEQEKRETLKTELEAQFQVALQEAETAAEEKVEALAAKLAAQQVAAGGAPAAVSTERGFLIPSYSHLEAVFEGGMGEKFRSLLLSVAADQMTGLLVVEGPEGTRYGYFDKGGPVGWRSEPLMEKEVLGVLLYRAKQITKEQLQESLQLMEEKNIRQGEAFIQMGVMSFSQMVMVLGKQVEMITQKVQKIDKGTYRFYVLDLPERFVPPPLKIPYLIYKELFQTARRLPGDQLTKALARQFNQYVSITTQGLKLISTMAFGAQEKRLIQVIQSNSWRMREIFSVSPLSRGATSAFLWAFHHLEFFAYSRTEGDSRAQARIDGLFKRKKRQIHQGSLFDVLEVHWISLPQEIEDSYNRLRAIFDPEKNKEVPSSLKQDSQFILKNLQDAFKTLKSDKKRREYRRKLIEKDLIIQSALLLAKKGEMAIMRRDRREGCSCFSKALELFPANQEYRDGLRRAAAVTSGS